MINRIVIISVFVFFLFGVADKAVSAIIQIHPRIWLDSAEIERMNIKQTSTQWTALESWCDAHLSDAGYDQGRIDWSGNNNFSAYRMGGYAQHLMNYSLAYQTLKDDNPDKAATYASRVRTLLIDGIAVGLKAGEENNGIVALRCGETADKTINAAEAIALGIGTNSYKGGYASRFIAAVPIAYDWIHETLSPEDKAILTPMLYRWFDWLRGVRSVYNNGVLVSGIRYHEDQNGNCSGSDNCTTATGAATQGYSWGDMGANFMGGHTYLLSLIPVATYGDSLDDDNYLEAFRSLLSGTIMAQLESDLRHSGGDSVEGWNYGGGFIYALPGLYGYYTATGDTAISGMAWPGQLVNAMLHRTFPDLTKIPLYGDWPGVPLGVHRRQPVLVFSGIQQRLNPSGELAGIGRYLLDNIPFQDAAELWQEVLWTRPDISPIALSTQPLYYLAKGNGFFNSRSSWEPTGVFLAARLEGKTGSSHESYDEGHFSVARGGDRLLVHKDTRPDSVWHNTVVFNNQNHHANNPPLVTPVIDRIQGTVSFSYVSADITNAWHRQWNADRASLYRRSLLHLFPGFTVVYDVTRSNSTLGNVKDWYTQYIADPTISGDTISATVGSSKVFTKTLFPSGGAFTETVPMTGFWRVKYTPAVAQEYDQFLHVIEATNKTQPAMTKTVRIDANSGNMRGVYISDPMKSDNNWVAMFTADKSGALVNADISYVVPAEIGYPPYGYAPKHIFVDLTPNTDFTFISPKSKNVSPQLFWLKSGRYPTEGRVYTSSSQGVVIIEPTGKVQINNK